MMAGHPAALIAWSWCIAPWADATRWHSMGSGFRGSRARIDANDLVVGLLILAAAAGGVFLLTRLLSRQDRQRRHNNPRGLFRNLCGAHGLDRPSRRLLGQLARWQKLPHPAQLFLEPDRFRAEALSPKLRQQLPALEKIRDQIFAQ